MLNKEMLSYAEQYVSYVINNLEPQLFHQIKEVILFGSVARGEATRASDIDIFFNVSRESKILSRHITTLTEKFTTTEFYRIWKSLGIENDIKPLVDILEGWNLKQSIIASGITLLGKYKAPIKGGSPLVIIYWQPIKNQSKRVLLSKKLYGYSYKKKRYSGILTEKALKLSSSCLAVPLEDAGAVFGVFGQLKVPYKSMYVGKME